MAFTTLRKALPQDRYISIASVNIGTPEISDRDFGGLIFTETASIIVNGTTKEFAFDKMIEVYTADQAMNYFGSGADETEMAIQYFGYRSPRGFSPRRLCFVRKYSNPTNEQESYIAEATASMDKAQKAQWIENYKKENKVEYPVDAIVRINGLTNNFGGFMYAQAENYTVAQMEDVVKYVNTLDHKYLFSLSFPVEVEADDEAASDTALIGATNARDFVIKLANGKSLPSYAGTCVWVGHNVDDNDTDESSDDETINSAIASIMPLSILGAVRYSGTNTVTNYMFKQFASQKYTVDDEAEADAYDALCINYIGLVQGNGDRKAFTQQGYNINGEATNTYCNEMWIKSEVATAILNLFLESETVSSEEDGRLLIYNTIASVAVRAKNNGTIAIGKTLDDDQKRSIYQYTQEAEAWRTVQESGYWLNVQVRRVSENGKTFYKAYYILVYSKDDAILKVEGSHALV